MALLLTSAGIAALPGVSGLGSVFESEHVPVELRSLAARSAVFGNDGTLITFLSEEENREPIDLSDIPQDVVNTILASEDAAFYQHNGVSPSGIARAALRNLQDGGTSQGGSTITQQLVKNAILSSDQTAERKAEEIYLALEIERELTKDEILERYLNTVYFGSGAYGVQVAAETYWGYESADELTECDAALLAGIIPSPIEFDPTRFPDAALQRRSVVINRLISAGRMDDAEAESCRNEPLPVQRLSVVDSEPSDYFSEEVLRLLLKDDADQYGLGEDQSTRFNRIFTEGLQIYTTLDPVAQAAAEEAQRNFAPRNPDRFTTAIASVDTHSGAVRALVGGPGFRDDQFNIATQGEQQPGSTMKTFVLAALFENGYVPTDTVRADSPCSFREPSGKLYTVSSAGGSGRQTIASVTRSSFNCPFLRLGQVVGNDEVVKVAERLGISTFEEGDGDIISLPLGVEEMIPLEVAGAYASFGNDGLYNRPYFIERIEDSQGNVIYEHRPNPSRAVAADTARHITETLRGNVTREFGNGTGRRAQVVLEDGTQHIVAGKTGTTNSNVSAWFAGYTDYLTTAVWVGHPDGNIPIDTRALNREAYNVQEYCCLTSAQGGTAAAPIFDYYMEIVHEGLEPRPFPQPEVLASRRAQYLVAEDEEITRFCTGSLPPDAAALVGQPVDVDGDGIQDCLVPQVAPGQPVEPTPEPVDPGQTTTTQPPAGPGPITPPTLTIEPPPGVFE